MDIENEVFKRAVIDFNKLIPFGFKKEKEYYSISKKILDDTFRIDVFIDFNKKVTGRAFDLVFDFQYTNFRVQSQNGEFVNLIKDEFRKFLEEIKNNCTSTNYFISNQANRIASLIEKEYGDRPSFPWDDLSSSGVFRNPVNNKWYGLIMNIKKDKIAKGEEEVEVLNIKLDKEKIKELLTKNGYYRAYHMNKENWITIILDDTLGDKEIIDLVKESHKFTEKK